MKLKDTNAQTSFDYLWLIKRIYPYLKPYLKLIILSILISIPLGLADGVFAFSLKPYFDFVINKQNAFYFGNQISYKSLAAIIPLVIIGIATIQGIFHFLNAFLCHWLSLKITNTIKTDLFKKLIYMDAKFFDENSSGIIINRFLYDPVLASRGIVDYLHNFILSIFGALSLIIVMFLSSYKLTIIGILGLCSACIPAFIVRQSIKKTSNQFAVISGDILTTFNETFNGNKLISVYSLQNKQINKYNQNIENAFDVDINLQKKLCSIYPFMQLITAIAIAVVLLYGTSLIYKGEMTSGAFVSYATSLVMLYKPIKMIGFLLTNIQNLFVAMGRIFELFDCDESITKNIKGPLLNNFSVNIEFDNVNFEYTKDQTILKNLCFKINKGETVALVGNSGGGKSTIASLIPRLYETNTGSIKIDGIDIKEYNLESLRNSISYVFQDIFLFTGSIKENIVLESNISDEELYSVINACKLDDLIKSLPEGINTLIGERGLTLSGGERQRVAIARAMVKNSPIIILDEATSSLDNEVEANVQIALENLVRDKTVILIAHRLSTIKNADKIFVINNGELVEQGTHDELLSKDDSYYKYLYELQFKGNIK